jgi:multiple sugar transport system substrate-binding protein
MNPKLADPNYDADDLIDGYVYNIGFAGGEKGYLQGKTGSLFGIPYGSETSILGYRTGHLREARAEVPETYDEMLELACKIPELEPGMGGVASRAASGHHAATPSCCIWRRSAGGCSTTSGTRSSTTRPAWRRPTR